MVLNMPRFWIYHGSENTKILNIPRFCICNCSEFTRVRNMLGFWICLGSDYTGVLNIPLLHSFLNVWISMYSSCICLIISKYVRMLNTNSTLLWLVYLRLLFPYLKIVQKKKKKCIIFIKSSVLYVWQGCKYSWGLEYTRVFKMPEFWIC